MLKPTSIYFWLSSAKVQEAQSFDKEYTQNFGTEEDKEIFDKINAEADILTPVNSDGWRTNDIDAYNDCTNPVALNILGKRLSPIPTPQSNDLVLSDSQIASNIVNSQFTRGDILSEIGDAVSDMREAHSEIDYLNSLEQEPLSVDSTTDE